MTLQGSLDAFALQDVLGLLASTRKSGELRVRGDWSDGRIWVHEGLVVDAEAPRARTIPEAFFELLRIDDGTFSFDAGAGVPDGEGLALEPILEEAQARLTEWRVIEAVVPSLSVPVVLAARAPGSRVTLNAEQWRIVVAIGSGGTVEQVADALEVGEYGACAAVKQLVDAGLVEVERPDEDRPAPDLDDLVQIPSRSRRGKPEPAAAKPERATRTRASSRGAAARDNEADEPDEADPLADVDVPAVVASLTPEHARELAAELAELGTPAAVAVEAAAAAATPEERAAALQEAFTDERGEPINRSLLLKFLSSVRS